MLLVMDMINDLVHDDGPSGYKEELHQRGTLPKTEALIAHARSRGVRIGYVRIGFSADYRECPRGLPIFSGVRKAGLFKLGTWGTRVHPAIAPRPEGMTTLKRFGRLANSSEITITE